ncbi:MAG: ribonuclease P protein component [Candidatus Eisenbacteria sp.]|nr:ribonuclease P protein component [Candidatus Eisenbacteria bacterium]
MTRNEITLRSRREIDKLFNEGDVYRGAHVVSIVRRVDKGPRRAMFVASRRVGNAVRRNRAKRVMREAYRGLAGKLSSDRIHLAWIARASCARTGMREVRNNMKDILTKAGVTRTGQERV